MTDFEDRVRYDELYDSPIDENGYPYPSGECECPACHQDVQAEPTHEYLITATVQFVVKEPHESWALGSAKDRLHDFLAAGYAPNDPMNGAVIDDVRVLDGAIE